MVSRSSKSKIAKRTVEYWKKHQIWKKGRRQNKLQAIATHLQKEYNFIPEKERIGKGSVYIAKSVGRATKKHFVKQKELNHLGYIIEIFNYQKESEHFHMQNYAIVLLGEYCKLTKKTMEKALTQIKQWVKTEKWEVREMCVHVIRETLKKFPDETIEVIKKWIKNEDENIRRTAIESIRPLRDIPWLRNPYKNGEIITILKHNITDPSIYVRKSVGNNLKDLSKYMPEKILHLLEKWVKEKDITVTKDLASKTKKELGIENYNLIWTIKHSLRWLRKKNPEYHKDIERIIGNNYVLYYDEKRNRLAKKK